VAVADGDHSGQGRGHENDHVHDHHRSLPLAAGLDHGKACSMRLRPLATSAWA